MATAREALEVGGSRPCQVIKLITLSLIEEFSNTGRLLSQAIKYLFFYHLTDIINNSK